MTQLDELLAILQRTPALLQALLRDLPEVWVTAKDGPEAWSPYDVLTHLIHCDQVNWIPRAKILLAHGTSRAFDPFPQLAHFELGRGRRPNALLDEFEPLRRANVEWLRTLNLTGEQLRLEGRHPDLGPVTLGNLLETWTIHDLNHTRQIVEAMARQRTAAVGPWRKFLPILET